MNLSGLEMSFMLLDRLTKMMTDAGIEPQVKFYEEELRRLAVLNGF